MYGFILVCTDNDKRALQRMRHLEFIGSRFSMLEEAPANGTNTSEGCLGIGNPKNHTVFQKLLSCGCYVGMAPLPCLSRMERPQATASLLLMASSLLTMYLKKSVGCKGCEPQQVSCY
eukprot:jgi/Botrbrau1/11267/Bobra.0038s0038.1